MAEIARSRTARLDKCDLRLTARFFRDRSAKHLRGCRDEDSDLFRSRFEIDRDLFEFLCGWIVERDLKPVVMFEVVLPQAAARSDPQSGCREVREVPGANDVGFRRPLTFRDNYRPRHRLLDAIDAAILLYGVSPGGLLVDRDSACSDDIRRTIDTCGSRGARVGELDRRAHNLKRSGGRVPHEQG